MKLSIITVCYNNLAGLKRTVESINIQTARNAFEYIIIDGASSDGTKNFLRSTEIKIDKWTSEPDNGIYNAMNKGVDLASGDYCLFLNSGDVLHDCNVIEKAINEIDNHDLVIGKIIFLNSMSTSVVNTPITLQRLYVGSIPHPGTFIRTELLRENPYDESLKIASDWKFFLQALIIGNCSYKIVDLIITDFECDGISATNKDLCELEREQVLKDLFPERILLDYYQRTYGEGYEGSTYDNFYVKLRNYRYGEYLYSLNVLFMKFIALFRKGARFSRNYPVKLPRS